MPSGIRRVRISTVVANQAAKTLTTGCLLALGCLVPIAIKAQPLPKITEPAMSFAEAKNHDHGDKVITIEGNFLERGLDEHVDNHLLVTFGNYVLIGRDGKRIKLWFDFAALGLQGAQKLSIEMVHKPHLRVRYDPDCGLALKIEAIGPWASQVSTVQSNPVPVKKNIERKMNAGSFARNGSPQTSRITSHREQPSTLHVNCTSFTKSLHLESYGSRLSIDQYS